VPRVRITEDTLWFDHSYRKGEKVQLEGNEYLDLLMAGRVETLAGSAPERPPALAPDEIEGRHKGELVFVLGNGPSLSLAQEHAAKLPGFTTVGVNRSFALLRTTYLLFLDVSFWAVHAEEVLACDSVVFCPKRLHLPYFTQFSRHHARDKKDVLSESWRDGLYWSRSSGVAAINLAYLFGASEIALLGVDLRDRSHFYSDSGRNRPFLHVDRILEDLWWMSRKLQARGVKLWNCSPESAVRGFEKIGLGTLLRRFSKTPGFNPGMASRGFQPAG
jgi:hypothetical protein